MTPVCVKGHARTPENVTNDRACRECKRESNRRRYHRNPGPSKAASQRWAEANRERSRRLKRESAERNPESAKASAAKWRSRNRDKVRATYRRWAEQNPEQANANSRVQAKRRKLRLKGVLIVPFTAAQLAAKMAYYGNRCVYCGGLYEHVDHFKPISKGGPHMLANLRPSCASCNLSKGSR